MQVYQSLRLAGLEGEPVALGAWYFSNDQRGLERRLYLSIKAETSLAYGTVCAAAFRAHFLDADIRASPVGSPFASAWYAVAPSLGEGASARLATDVLSRLDAVEA